MRDIDHIVSKIIQVHHDENSIAGSTDNEQHVKLIGYIDTLISHDEQFELMVGSIMSTLINMCERNKTSVETCLNKFYDN